MSKEVKKPINTLQKYLYLKPRNGYLPLHLYQLKKQFRYTYKY